MANESIAVIPRFKHESPKGRLMLLYDRFVKPQIFTDLIGCEVQPTYLLCWCV